jgi:5-methylcytosine-specific restriction endonuclease McrBC GTP-binding regulatory subunit McrB
MIGLNTQMVQYFLNRNPHRRTAPPYADDKTGPESALKNSQAKFKGIIQQFLSRKVSFFFHNPIRASAKIRES